MSIDLPPELDRLATALGVSDVVGFLEHPAERLTSILTNGEQRDALLALLSDVIGETAERHEVPGSSTTETWFPLIEDGPGGLYLVMDVLGADDAADVRLAVAGRLRHLHEAPGEPGIDARASVRVPLLEVTSTGVEPLVGGDAGAVTVAVQLRGVGGPLLDAEGVSAQAIVLRTTIATDPDVYEGVDPGDPATLSLVVEGLRFSADDTPADLDIVDLVAGLGDAAGRQQVVQLLLGALRAREGAPPALQRLFALLGLGGPAAIPSFPLVDAFTSGETALRDWVRGLLTDAAARSAWLGELAGLFGLPFTPGSHELCLVGHGAVRDDATKVCLTVDVDTDPTNGAPRVRVGLVARHTESGALTATLEARAALLHATLSSPAVIVPVPGAVVGARLTGTADPATGALAPLVEAPDIDGRAVRVGSLLLGVEATTDPADLEVIVVAEDVQLDTATFARLDLTDADAVIGAAADAVESAVADLLGTLTDLLETTPQAQALACLLGLVAPPGGAWTPALVEPLGLIDDPLRAIACYHRRVLDVDGAWGRLLPQVGVLLDGGAAATTAAQAGTAADPWQLARAGSPAASFRLVAWTEDVDGARHLRIGARGGLTTAADGVTFAAEATSELLDLRLPAADCSGPVDLDVARCHTLALSVGEDLRVALDGIVVELARAEVGVTWCRGGDPEPHVVLRGVAITDRFGRVGLPDMDAFSLDLPALGADGLRVVGRLLGTWVTGGGSFGAVLGDLLALLPGLGDGGLAGLRDLLGIGDLSLSELGFPGDVPVRVPGMADLVAGTGSYDDPWRLTVLPDGVPTPVSWLDPDGPPRVPTPYGLVPPVLRAAVLDGGPPLDAALLGRLVSQLGSLVPGLGGTLDADVGAALTALRQALADSDGLVSVAAQTPEPADGWNVVPIGPTTHLHEPAADLDALVPGLGPAAGRLLVTGPVPWLAPWQAVDASRVIDLTEVGRDAATFDLDHVTGPGPWVVRLPSRADAASPADGAGLAGQVARLRRAADAVRAATGGAVSVVAHGVAGVPARALASEPGVVDHLVLLGTPLRTPELAWLDDGTVRAGVRLLQHLRTIAGDRLPAGTPDDVIRTLAAAIDGVLEEIEGAAGAADTIRRHVPFPLADLAPPAFDPLAPGVTATAIVGRLLPTDVDGLLTAVVGRAIEATLAPPPAPALPTHVGYGLLAELRADDGAPGSLQAAVSARLDVALSEAQAGPHRAAPALRIDVELTRKDGWLVAPADDRAGLPQDPRIRRASIELAVELGEPTPAAATAAPRLAARLVLHDVSVFGRWHERWVIDDSTLASLGATTSGATGTLPEVRVLIGLVAASINDATRTPLLTDVVALLEALDVAVTDAAGTVELVADGLEQLLRAPDALLASVLADATRVGALLDALADVAGGRRDGDALVLLDGPFELALVGTFPSWSARLRTTAPHALGTAADVEATITLAPDGRISGTVAAVARVELGTAGRPRVAITVDTSAVLPLHCSIGVTGDGGSRLPEVALLPAPDVAALGRLAQVVVPAELLRAGLTWARSAAASTIDPVLDAVGLLGAADEATPVRSPVGLVADPGRWLGSAVGLGTGAADRALDPASLVALVDAIAGLVGAGAGSGTLALPGGVTIIAQDRGGGTVAVSVTALPIAADAVGVAGSLTLVVAPLLDLSVEADATIRIAGADPLDSARLTVTVTGSGPRITVGVTPQGVSELALPVVPPATWGQLTSIASGAVSAAVTQVLPVVLDAVAGEAPIVGTIGDALGVRAGGSFDGPALVALANDPASVLRDGTVATALLPAVRTMLTQAGVAGVTATASGLRLQVHANVRVELTLGATPSLCLDVTEIAPTAGLALSGSVCVGLTGVTGAAAEVAFTAPALLDLGPVALFPSVRLELGDEATGPDRVLFAVRGGQLGPGGVAALDGVAVQVTTGGAVDALCVSGASESPMTPACVADVVLDVAAPLLGDLIIASEPVAALLDRELLGHAGLLRDVLRGGSILLDDGAGGDMLDASLLSSLRDLGTRVLGAAGALATAVADELLGASLGGFVLQPVAKAEDGRTWYGLRLAFDEAVVLADGSDVRLELDGYRGDFAEAGVVPGLTFYVASAAGGDLSAVRFTPRIDAAEIGLRVTGQGGGPLLQEAVGIRAAGLFASYDAGIDPATGDWDTRGGGARIALRKLSLPIGGGTGDGGNPVAQKMLSQATEGPQAGDEQEAAFSVDVELEVDEDGVELHVGVGDPPWWIPVQRSFGPLYVDQVGLEIAPLRDPQLFAVLFDGGLAFEGLAVGVDDLRIAYHLTNGLSLSLAGLAIGYDGNGLTLAGGLRHHDGEYLGMLELRFQTIGLTVLGGWGEHPVDAQSDETYTALFVFGALSASIGGPPPFFVTGIGAGIGVNRRLVLPETVEGVVDHPLVQAMDPTSPLAQDPMGALEALGRTFPPHRGTFWFAAGVRFTSFVLVESIAVLSVEVGDGVEVGLLGLSRMVLPDPALPLASIELALRARFSSREGVLAIQAQLTDNSWLLSESCRLTGGFAFVVWFRTGQFVLTLGGYHPRFQKPADFPDVPRLGFSWSVSSAITIKGGLYFALTSSAVMAGGSLEASYRTSWAWASFELGAHALIMWDPLAYDFEVYVRISAGVRIRICVPLLGCATVGFSFSIGANVRIWGPEFRGLATLDLDVVTLTVSFGATDDAALDEGLWWTEFAPKYLTDGGRGGLESSLGAGRYAEAGAGEDASGDAVDGPWRVLPEWRATITTTVASNVFNGIPEEDIEATYGIPITDALDLGPMRRDDVTNTLTVGIHDPGDTTDPYEGPGIHVVPRGGDLPAAVWTSLASSSDAPPAAELVTAVVGAELVLVADTGDVTGNIRVDQITEGRLEHPLPLRLSLHWRTDLHVLHEAAVALAVWAADDPARTDELLANATLAAVHDGSRWRLRQREAAQLTVTTEAVEGQVVVGAAGVLLDDAVARSARRPTSLAGRAAPPRVRSLAAGISPPAPEAVEVTLAAPPPPAEVPPVARPPRLEAVLHETVAPHADIVSTVTAHDLPRVPAPSLATVRTAALTSVGARLHLGEQRLAAAQATPGVRHREVEDGHRATPVASRPIVARARTGVAGDRHEWRLTDPRLRAETVAAMRRTAAAFPDDGVVLRTGDTHVWSFPDSRRDRRAAERTLHVEGDALVRVVALSRSGEPLGDVTVRAGEVAVPRGTDRLAVSAVSESRGFAGWHADTRLVRVSRTTALAPGAVVRAETADTRRRRQAVGAALVRGHDLAPRRGTVHTVLPGTTRTIVVGIAPTGADTRPDGLDLTLGGGRRVGDRPRLVTVGDRVYGVFAVAPDDGPGGVRASVAVDEDWDLVACVGTDDAAASVAAVVASGGLERRLEGLATSATGGARVRLVTATDDGQDGEGRA